MTADTPASEPPPPTPVYIAVDEHGTVTVDGVPVEDGDVVGALKRCLGLEADDA